MTTPTDDEILKLADQHQVICLGADGIAEPAWREGTDMGDEVIAFARALLAAAAPSPRGQRESPATLAAIADVEAGAQVAPSARKHGIQPSTLFRALARRRRATQAAAAHPSAPTPSAAAPRS